jgi:hypothetical protein
LSFFLAERKKEAKRFLAIPDSSGIKKNSRGSGAFFYKTDSGIMDKRVRKKSDPKNFNIN